MDRTGNTLLATATIFHLPGVLIAPAGMTSEALPLLTVPPFAPMVPSVAGAGPGALFRQATKPSVKIMARKRFMRSSLSDGPWKNSERMAREANGFLELKMKADLLLQNLLEPGFVING